jgi:hypothetical protein
MGGGGVELRDDSAISLASMADARDFYGGLVTVIEEDAVVSTAETETGFRRLESFHIAGAVG